MIFEYLNDRKINYRKSLIESKATYQEHLELSEYEFRKLAEGWLNDYDEEIDKYYEYAKKLDKSSLQTIENKYNTHKNIITNKYTFITTLLEAMYGLKFYNEYTHNKGQNFYSQSKATLQKDLERKIDEGLLPMETEYKIPKAPKKIGEFIYNSLNPHFINKTKLKQMIMSIVGLKQFNCSYKKNSKTISHRELFDIKDSFEKIEIKNPLNF